MNIKFVNQNINSLMKQLGKKGKLVVHGTKEEVSHICEHFSEFGLRERIIFYTGGKAGHFGIRTLSSFVLLAPTANHFLDFTQSYGMEAARSTAYCYIGSFLLHYPHDYSLEEFVQRYGNTEKIPRILHYCWFGGAPMPESYVQNLKSWERYCPGYEIKRWDESNYDIRKNQYMSDAYDNKKWAFVSDYCRIDVINEYGGIYLDTDVELLLPLDKFLVHECFLCIESIAWRELLPKPVTLPSFGTFGAVNGHSMLRRLLDYFNTVDFINADGSLNMTPNLALQMVLRPLVKGKNEPQEWGGMEGVVLYPTDVFVPISSEYFVQVFTKNTHAIHHFGDESVSWFDGIVEKRRISKNVIDFLKHYGKLGL